MTHVLSLVLLAGLVGQPTAAPKIELDAPVRLAFAGVKIALPKDFKLVRTPEFSSILRVAKMENDQPVMAVSLLGFPRRANDTLISFVEFAKPKAGPVIRKLQLLKTHPLRIAGREGELRIWTFEFRGFETTAVQIFFLRALPGDEGQLGYLLTVEGGKSRRRELLPLLGAVGDSVELFDPVRPISEEIAELGEPIVSQRWGYSIRPPKWWKIRGSRDNDIVEMLQADYYSNPRMPQASLQVKGETASAQECAKAVLTQLQETLKDKKGQMQVVREGPARMAGCEGYQFIVRHEIEFGEAEDAKPKLIVHIAQRTVCKNGNSYSMVAYYPAEKPEGALSALDTIAAGLELMAPVTTTAPTAAPAVGLPTLPPTTPATGPAKAIVPKYQE